MPTAGRDFGPTYQANRLIVLERDEYICQVCFEELEREPTRDTPDNHYPTAGHIIPWIISQDDSVENMHAECKRCNFRKGAKTEQRVAWEDPDQF